MKVDDFKDLLSTDLNKQLVSSKILLQNFRLIDETSRKAASYVDPRFAPFYYHLGKYAKPKSLLCVGFRLGLLPGCLLKSCDSVERIFAIERSKETYYSPKLAIKNIRQKFKGRFEFQTAEFNNPTDPAPFNRGVWDMTIVDEEMEYDVARSILDKIWDNTADGGLIVVDYLNGEKPNGSAFRDFAKIHNRIPTEFNTRYKVGIVEK